MAEINYRTIGDGREFLLNKLLPFNWFEKIITLYTGEKNNQVDIRSKSTLIQYFPNTVNCFLTKSQKAFEKQQNATTISYHSLKQEGQKLFVSHSNKVYLGMLTVIGDTISSIQKEVDEMTKELNLEITLILLSASLMLV